MNTEINKTIKLMEQKKASSNNAEVKQNLDKRIKLLKTYL